MVALGYVPAISVCRHEGRLWLHSPRVKNNHVFYVGLLPTT